MECAHLARGKKLAQPSRLGYFSKYEGNYFDIPPAFWQVFEICFTELTSSVWEFAPADPAAPVAVPLADPELEFPVILTS